MSDTETGGGDYWAAMHASFGFDQNNKIEWGVIRYEYSPLYQEELKRRWFWQEWNAHTIALRELRKRLQSLADEWGIRP